MEITYAQRLSLLHALDLNDAQGMEKISLSVNLGDYDPLDAASYLACLITYRAIQQSGRSPQEDRNDNFDMLSVYQAFAMLVYAYLVLPLGEDGLSQEMANATVTIAKSLFAELMPEELAEVVAAGQRKFELIGNAGQEHWANYREDLDKSVVAYVIAGTEDDAPYEREDVIPLFGRLLSMLCEAFASE